MTYFALQYVRGEIGKEEYLKEFFSELDVSRQCYGIDGCEDFIRTTITQAFWELDDLDRKDPFWNQSNNLPTITKLMDFSKLHIESNINVVNAAWLNIICNLIFVAHHLDIKPWKILKENNKLNLRFLVRTAWNISAYWMEEETQRFCTLIDELEIRKEIEPELMAIENISEEARLWVKNIKCKLKMDW